MFNSSPDGSDIRHSLIAGAWYPGSAGGLRQMIGAALAQVPEQALSGDLCALVAPHAGYSYSGPTAAYGYKQVLGKSFDAVVIVGPSHHAWFGEVAVSAVAAYETPLGLVEIDAELVKQLVRLLPLSPVMESQEHSIEIQLPFLQFAIGPFSLLPLLMSADRLESCLRLGLALADLLRGRNILLVASTDLNHLHSYSAVQRLDADVIGALERFELEPLANVLLDPSYTVCGRAPLLAACAAAQALGARKVHILHHTNSGDVTGRRSEGVYTVGYLSAALVK